MYWPRRSNRTGLPFALSVLLVAMCGPAWSGPYADLQAKLKPHMTPEQVIQTVESYPSIASQREIQSELASLKRGRYGEGDAGRPKDIADNLRTMVDLGSMAESGSQNTDDRSQAQAIKQSPFYRDKGIDRRNNWLSDAIDRLKNIHLQKPKRLDGNAPNYGAIGQFVTYFIWTVLIVGVIALLVWASKFVTWRNTLKRKSKALLEEDEPERTLDEWLQLADQHALAGRYREAVRALYLACLLRFDEHGVARFDRGETNWEHLARIQASPKLPEGLDFGEATRQFDRIWYGYKVNGQVDVDLFKTLYQEISEGLRSAP